MAEGEEVITKEVFDKMKQRFRKEAMQAVEEAEVRGYEKGRTETQSQYEEQAVMWKALADFIKSQNAGKVNATSLLKFIMGQVYKDAKKEFGGDSSDVLERLKSVLITSNDTLAAKMPEVLLGGNNNSTNNNNSSNNNIQTPFKTPGRRPSATSTTAAPTVTFQSGNSIVCHFRPQVFSCFFKPQPPKFFLHVKIPSIVENVVKGIFRASEYTSYKIETEVVPLSSVTNNPYATATKGNRNNMNNSSFTSGTTQCHVLDRRHSEFKAFYQTLIKAYPYLIIPWIKTHVKKDKHNTPPTNPNAIASTPTSNNSSSSHSKNKKGAAASNNDDDGDQHISNEKLNNRKRQYKMWLQFLGNIEAVQSSSHFVAFISGYKSWEDTLSAKGVVKNNSTIRQQTVYTIHANAARGLAMAVAAQNESFHAVSGSYSGNSNSSGGKYGASTSSTGHNANALESAMFDTTGRETMGGHHSGGRSSYMMHRLAYQDLHTVYRDVLQLEPNATSAIESTQNLVTSCKNATGALTVFIADIDEWSRCEPSGSYELHGLRVLSSACSFTLPNLYNIANNIQEGMSDHLEFLYGSYLHSAKDSLEGIMKTFNSKLVDKVMYSNNISSSSSSGAVDKGNNNSSKDVVTDRSSIADASGGITSEVSENIRNAVSVSTSWEAARASRSSILLQLMIDTAASLADEYKEITKQWEYAYTKLGGVERDPVLRNARENESRALSEVIKGELHAYEEKVESIQESYEATHKMQDMFVKLSGALRNPGASNMGPEEIARMEANYRDLKGIQAIKERPVLPAGVRRDPSVKPSVTFSDAQPTPQKSRSRTKSDHDRAAAAAAVNDSSSGNSGRPARPPPPAARPPPPSQQQHHHHQQTHQSAAAAAVDEEDTAVFDRRRPLPKRPTQGGGGAAGGGGAGATVTSAAAVASKIKATPTNNPQLGGNIFGSVAPQPGAAFAEGLATAAATTAGGGRVRTKSEYEAYVAAQQQQHGDTAAAAAMPSVTPSKTNRARTASEVNATASVPASSLPDVTPTRHHQQQHHASEEPLPEGWEQVVSEEGQVYYYHRVTRLSRWDRPTEKVAAALNERLRQEKADIDEAIQKRKQEYQQQRAVQEEKEGMIEQLQSKVNVVIKKWRLMNDGKTVKDISELLNTTHQIVNIVPEGGIVVGDPLTPKSNPPDIKKAYMRAVRYVHPDKLPETIDVETAMLAERVFITLTDAFNAYRTKIEAAYNAANNR